MTQILLTGASGYVGSHLLDELRSRHEVAQLLAQRVSTVYVRARPATRRARSRSAAPRS